MINVHLGFFLRNIVSGDLKIFLNTFLYPFGDPKYMFCLYIFQSRLNCVDVDAREDYEHTDNKINKHTQQRRKFANS